MVIIILLLISTGDWGFLCTYVSNTISLSDKYTFLKIQFNSVFFIERFKKNAKVMFSLSYMNRLTLANVNFSDIISRL